MSKRNRVGFTVISCALFIFMAILVIPPKLNACSCICRGSLKALVTDSFKRSTSVFIGRVLEVKLERRVITMAPGHTFPAVNYKARFAVEEPFKGVTDDSIWADTGDGDCSPGELHVGEQYLIYAYRPASDKNLFVGSCCNRSREMSNERYSKAEKKEHIKEIRLLRSLKLANKGTAMAKELRQPPQPVTL
jgi:hypothetical protein